MTLIAASDPTQQPALDPAALEGLWELVDDDDTSFLEDLFGSYLVNVQESLAGIRSFLVAGEFDAIRREAHTLKGASGNVGAMVLSALCRQLESSAEAQDASAIEADQASIAAESRRVRLAISRILPELPVA